MVVTSQYSKASIPSASRFSCHNEHLVDLKSLSSFSIHISHKLILHLKILRLIPTSHYHHHVASNQSVISFILPKIKRNVMKLICSLTNKFKLFRPSCCFFSRIWSCSLSTRHLWNLNESLHKLANGEIFTLIKCC